MTQIASHRSTDYYIFSTCCSLNLTERQGKELLRAHGIAVPGGMLIRSADQARRWRRDFPIALKVQIASGGRGKAGGVLRAANMEEAEAAAQRLFESDFSGERPQALLLEPWLDHARELYSSDTMMFPCRMVQCNAAPTYRPLTY